MIPVNLFGLDPNCLDIVSQEAILSFYIGAASQWLGFVPKQPAYRVTFTRVSFKGLSGESSQWNLEYTHLQRDLLDAPGPIVRFCSPGHFPDARNRVEIPGISETTTALQACILVCNQLSAWLMEKRAKEQTLKAATPGEA